MKNSDIPNEKPEVFKGVITYRGERCDIHHVAANNFDDIPDELKIKAHALCLHNGQIVLVHLTKWNIWSIPGGTREPGESIEETLHREVREETNCAVVDYAPIAYQKVMSPSGDIRHYRLVYRCNVVPEGDFTEDPAGHVRKIAWVPPHEAEAHVEDKDFKKVVFRSALDLKDDKE
ncbi:MAG: NUDIX hydrolase [Patescibacteria group bacterium UBA2163]